MVLGAQPLARLKEDAMPRRLIDLSMHRGALAGRTCAVAIFDG
jgi:hypothetical protein